MRGLNGNVSDMFPFFSIFSLYDDVIHLLHRAVHRVHKFVFLFFPKFPNCLFVFVCNFFFPKKTLIIIGRFFCS